MANGGSNAIPPPPDVNAAASAPADAAPVNTAPATEAPAGGETASAPAPAAPVSSGASEGSAGPSSGMVPESGSKMAYYVVKGDSLAVISKKIFGSQGKWKTLASGNNIIDPNKIYAGDVIFYTVDDSARDFAQKYESAARQSVTVAAGDTLSKISLKVYGTEGAWRTLWKENPQVKNPDLVRVGMVLSFRGGQASALNEEGSNNEETAQTEEVSAQ